MRIAWDGRALSGVRTGIGWYTSQLLRAFERIGGDWTAQLITNQPVQDVFSEQIKPRLIRYPNAAMLRSFWENRLLPRALAQSNPDIWHSTLSVVPKTGRYAKIATVHDIAFHLFPEILPPTYRRYWTTRIQQACRFSDRIVADSETTRADLIHHFGADPARVEVVYAAADSYFSTPASASEKEEALARWDISPGFLLFVGTQEPRKNLGFLLQVYEEWLDRGNPLLPLVLVGAKGWLESARPCSMITSRGRVVVTGYVSPAELRALYQSASILLVPSKYEGFGLPAAEAMSAGGVVLAARNSSLIEVVGEGGVLLPLDDPGVWVDKMEEILQDQTLAESVQKRARGQAARFSWDATAKRLLEIYQETVDLRSN